MLGDTIVPTNAVAAAFCRQRIYAATRGGRWHCAMCAPRATARRKRRVRHLRTARALRIPDAPKSDRALAARPLSPFTGPVAISAVQGERRCANLVARQFARRAIRLTRSGATFLRLYQIPSFSLIILQFN